MGVARQGQRHPARNTDENVGFVREQDEQVPVAERGGEGGVEVIDAAETAANGDRKLIAEACKPDAMSLERQAGRLIVEHADPDLFQPAAHAVRIGPPIMIAEHGKNAERGA
jgi:hypothetical protein